MTSILFLTNAADRLQAAAAWVAANWRERRPLVVFAPAADMAERVDRVLWTQQATGFLPHCRLESSLAAETPVLIAGSLDSAPHDACVLNLSNEIPTGFSRFEQLVEIVSVDDADRLPARDRFRFYRERGYPLESRQMTD